MAASPHRPRPPSTHHSARGLLLGLVGVTVFALTLPMTRLAVGDHLSPQLPPAFVTFGRAATAGALSLAYLAALAHMGRLNRPQQREWMALALTAACVVLGFPMGLALALREVPSAHAAAVTGLLPLATAGVAAVWFRQRPSLAFWCWALLGAAVVLGFMCWQSNSWHLSLADAWLLLAMGSAAVGYVSGARLTPRLGAEQVICWLLVLVLPVTLPLAWLAAPSNPGQIAPASWAAFAYVAVFSMWLGFFAWYRGLAIGGAIRVSQVQLAQPFMSMVFAVPLLGEPLDPVTLLFGLAITTTVLMGRRAAVSRQTGQ